MVLDKTDKLSIFSWARMETGAAVCSDIILRTRLPVLQAMLVCGHKLIQPVANGGHHPVSHDTIGRPAGPRRVLGSEHMRGMTMTDTATAPAQAPQPDQLVQVVTGTLGAVVSEANTIADQYAANSKDSTSLVHEIRDVNETSDPEVTKFREFWEQANAKMLAAQEKIDAYIRENLMPKGDEAFDADKAKAKHAELKSQYNATVKMLKTLPNYDESWLANVGEFKNLRGGTVSAGQGSGGRRPRVSEIHLANADGSNRTEIFTERDGKGEQAGTKVKVTNLTTLAKVISDKEHANTKVEVKDLQAALFAAAGTEDLSTVPGKVFSFAFSAGDKTYQVEVTTSDPDAA